MRLVLAIVLCATALQDKPALPPEPDAAAQKETLVSFGVFTKILPTPVTGQGKTLR